VLPNAIQCANALHYFHLPRRLAPKLHCITLRSAHDGLNITSHIPDIILRRARLRTRLTLLIRICAVFCLVQNAADIILGPDRPDILEAHLLPLIVGEGPAIAVFAIELDAVATQVGGVADEGLLDYRL
jgi:hypothetical protein